jgi:hypothetical protein
VERGGGTGENEKMRKEKRERRKRRGERGNVKQPMKNAQWR